MVCKDNTKIVFIHIPKTGGMTFRGILQNLYGDAYHYCISADVGDIRRRLTEFSCLVMHWHKNRFIHEHVLAADQWETLKPAAIFALFRELEAHTLSLFSDIQRHKDELLPIFQHLGRTVPATLEDYLAQEPPNQQLAFLLGRLQGISRPVGAADLAEAKQMISAIGMYVGLTERYDDFLHIFEATTGLQISDEALKIKNRNPHSREEELEDNATWQRITDRNELDLELYHFVQRLAAEQMQRTSVRRRQYRFE